MDEKTEEDSPVESGPDKLSPEFRVLGLVLIASLGTQQKAASE
jgi:hypothetical protein